MILSFFLLACGEKAELSIKEIDGALKRKCQQHCCDKKTAKKCMKQCKTHFLLDLDEKGKTTVDISKDCPVEEKKSDKQKNTAPLISLDNFFKGIEKGCSENSILNAALDSMHKGTHESNAVTRRLYGAGHIFRIYLRRMLFLHGPIKNEI